MPGLYSTPALFAHTPLGAAVASWTANLPTSLDQIAFEASADIENTTDRKLQAPPTDATVVSAVNGASSFVISDCIGVYETDVVVISGTAYQVTGVEPNYQVISGSYQGTVYLATSIIGYAALTPVVVYRQSRYMVRGRQTQAGMHPSEITQEAQLAALHAPAMSGGSARRIFFSEYPVWSIYAAFQTLDIGGTDNAVSFSGSYLNQEIGWYRLPLGFYNPRGSIWRLQYVAGYAAVPQDIRDACHLLMADKVSRAMNPMGAQIIRNEDVMVHLTRNTATAGQLPPASSFIENAERKLVKYKRRGVR